MRRLKLLLEYDGTPFHGWQRIQEGPSVQAAVEEAIFQITAERTDLAAAGRTDKGVHALGQVAHFDTASDKPLIKFLDGITHYCTPHIIVTRVEEVDTDFHARFNATARHYEYLIFNRRALRPTLHNRAAHVRTPLDTTAMQAAIANIPTGENDWSAYRSSECQSQTPMVNLHSLNLEEKEPHLLKLTIVADHFLHHMVRTLAGTLIETGQGKRSANNPADVLAGKNRTKAGPTAPAGGLSLTRVTYPPHRVMGCCPAA